MSATRLLILGALLVKEPLYGYEIRQELERWHAEQWADVAYGSIYSALTLMAKDGLVEVAASATYTRRTAKTHYRITLIGKEAFAHLLRKYWSEWQTINDPFLVALMFINFLPPGERLVALQHRQDLLQGVIAITEQAVTKATDIPPHMVAIQRLLLARYQTDLQWLQTMIAKYTLDQEGINASSGP